VVVELAVLIQAANQIYPSKAANHRDVVKRNFLRMTSTEIIELGDYSDEMKSRQAESNKELILQYP
jgi:hypothetical protein